MSLLVHFCWATMLSTRVPRIVDLPMVGLMCFVLMICTTKTELISDLGKTLLMVGWTHRRSRSIRFSRCRDSVAYITAMQSQPKRSCGHPSWVFIA